MVRVRLWAGVPPQGMCEGGYPGYAMIAFTDPTGYRPEQCYPYKYDGDAEQHFGADVRAVTCDIAWAAGVSKGVSFNTPVDPIQPLMRAVSHTRPAQPPSLPCVHV